MSERRVAVILAGGKGTRLAPIPLSFRNPWSPWGSIPLWRYWSGSWYPSASMNSFSPRDIWPSFWKPISQPSPEEEGHSLSWIKEQKPLGTAGPLRRISGLPDNFLVLNGDLFTTMDFEKLFRNHLCSDAALTIAMHRKTVRLQLGCGEAQRKQRQRISGKARI